MAERAAPNRASEAAKRGLDLIERYGSTGQTDLIADAIRSLQSAVADAPDDDPDRVRYISNLANALLLRFRLSGQISDLNESITLDRQAIAASSPDDSTRSVYLFNLGNALVSRAEQSGDIADLTEAIAIQEQALAISAQGDPERGNYLVSLGNALLARFRRTGDPADVSRAVELGREAVAESPPRDPRRAQYAVYLGDALQTQATIESDDSRRTSLIEEALTLADRTLDSDADNNDASLVRASALRMLGRYTEAEATLRHVLESVPNPRAASELAEVLRLTGRNDEATAVTEQFSGSRPSTLSGDESATDASDQPERLAQGAAVSWVDDSPAVRDLLNRDALATVIAGRLREIHAAAPEISFLIHLDGSWGAGKTTLLNFLESKLQDDCLVVRLDAWQQSGIGPPWWTLLTTTRQAIVSNRKWWRRLWFRLVETCARTRQTGAPFLLAVLILITVIGSLAYALWPQKATTASWSAIAQSVTTIAAAVALFWAGSRVAVRFLLWDSAGGARLFEQSSASPVPQISKQFTWLTKQSPGPIMLFVDNLDRCDSTYVVSFLDSIQTIVRDEYTSADAALEKKERHAVTFVVAADGAWLRASYEDTYKDFYSTISLPGRPLGYLFLDKIFQLSVPMPTVTRAGRRALLDNLLLIGETTDSIDDTQVAKAKTDLEKSRGDPERIRSLFQSLPPLVARAVSGDAAKLLAEKDTRRRTEHKLQKFAGLLDENPRTMKRFLNTFTILETVRTIEAEDVDFDSLALWSIIRVRWPQMADYLEQNPAKIANILDPVSPSGVFPENLKDAAAVPDLRRVAQFTYGGPLTAELISRYSGNTDDLTAPATNAEHGTRPPLPLVAR